MVWAFGRWPGSDVENSEGDMWETGSGAGGPGSDDTGWGNLCCPVTPSPHSPSSIPLPPRHLVMKSPGKESLPVPS